MKFFSNIFCLVTAYLIAVRFFGRRIRIIFFVLRLSCLVEIIFFVNYYILECMPVSDDNPRRPINQYCFYDTDYDNIFNPQHMIFFLRSLITFWLTFMIC